MVPRSAFAATVGSPIPRVPRFTRATLPFLSGPSAVGPDDRAPDLAAGVFLGLDDDEPAAGDQVGGLLVGQRRAAAMWIAFDLGVDRHDGRIRALDIGAAELGP